MRYLEKIITATSEVCFKPNSLNTVGNLTKCYSVTSLDLGRTSSWQGKRLKIHFQCDHLCFLKSPLRKRIWGDLPISAAPLMPQLKTEQWFMINYFLVDSSCFKNICHIFEQRLKNTPTSTKQAAVGWVRPKSIEFQAKAPNSSLLSKNDIILTWARRKRTFPGFLLFICTRRSLLYNLVTLALLGEKSQHAACSPITGSQNLLG